MTDLERYLAACHAMQSGVSFEMQHLPAPTTTKHLRVGVNSAMVETGTLTRLLIAKGVFTEEEHLAALADQMEAEVLAYELRLSEHFGQTVKLV